ncbi:MAG TPA: hypothetical protein VFV87_21650, partial [Pirellulaceae bacterium]|nr:hypothetical protein [Pirellulaceae bacterium]
MKHSFVPLALAAALALFAGSGCTPQPAAGPTGGETTPAVNTGDGGAEEQIPFKLGDMIEPFTPPTLAELNAKAEWEDRPVLDSFQLLREHLAESKPLVSVEEALKLRNDGSKAVNEKILSGLGQYPASEDEALWDASINRLAFGDVNSTNPLLISSTIEFDVSGLIGFGLFGFDWNFNNFAAK